MVAEEYLLQMSIISHMETQRYVPLLFVIQNLSVLYHTKTTTLPDIKVISVVVLVCSAYLMLLSKARVDIC